MAESNGKLISELKVHELRSELISRGLDGNGVKAALVARLEKILSEQGVDINSYLFSTGSDIASTSTSMETENNDGTAAAAVVAASKDETGKNKEEQKEAVQENAAKPDEAQAKENKNNEVVSNSMTSDDLIEKVEDEIDEAELHGENDDSTTKVEVNGNANANEASPDIGDLEEREESEGDDAKNESVPMEAKIENKEEQQQQTTAIHEISDEELDDDMEGDDNAQPKEEPKEDVKPPTDDVKAEPAAAETKTKEADDNAKKDVLPPAKSRVPAGLNFPSDDPQGLRCIWIRSIPSETRLAELKLAFIDAGFTVETAKIFTTKQGSRPSAFGFMTMASQEDAKNAVAKMNNSIFKGKTITVERAGQSSMLQSDLLPAERPKVSHPPIKPPEDTKPVVDANRSRIITTTKHTRSHDISRSRPERHHERSPYMNSVNRSRIIRTEPQRVVEATGRNIRVVATRDLGGSSRSSRRSPVRLPQSSRRERTPPRRERTPPRRERTPPRRHRTPERDRIAEHERRKYEDIMRKKEEEFRRKEEALRMEAERNRIKLEKERLEKENLELKLKLQKEQLRAAAATSTSNRPPSSHGRTTSSRHREPTPPRRSSRHPSPPRHIPSSSSRRTPERRDARHPSSYRPEEPPKEVYPTRRRSRSRSPVRTSYPAGSRDRPEEFSRGRGHEHGSSSRHARPESPVRNLPPAKSYERHSPRRNYEPSRSDRSRRNDKIDVTYPPPIEEPQRSSRSSRNGNGRDLPPPNSFDRSSSDTFGTTRRDPGNHFSTTSSNPPNYNFTGGAPMDYRAAPVNPSYSTSSGNSRNQLPSTSTWPQQTYATTNQPQAWAHQPQPIAALPPQWNPQSNFTGMRNNNSNQRYGGF
jgi:hypothetical protein